MVKSHALSKIILVGANSHWVDLNMHPVNIGAGLVILQVETVQDPQREYNLYLLVEIVKQEDYCYEAKAEATGTSTLVRGSRA